MSNDLIQTIKVQDGTPVANSRDVAEHFEKRHDHVLRDIDAISTSPDLGASDWFRPTLYLDAKGETRRSFYLTRDGFTLLVMGWTGARAMKFKVAYIQAFNAMEAELARVARPDLSNPRALRQEFRKALDLLDETETKLLEAETKIVEDAPKVEFYDDFIEAEGYFGIRAAAKIMGVPPRKLGDQLNDDKYTFFDNKGERQPYQKFVDAGFFSLKICTINGQKRSWFVITPLGFEHLARKYGVK